MKITIINVLIVNRRFSDSILSYFRENRVLRITLSSYFGSKLSPKILIVILTQNDDFLAFMKKFNTFKYIFIKSKDK